MAFATYAAPGVTLASSTAVRIVLLNSLLIIVKQHCEEGELVQVGEEDAEASGPAEVG